MTDIDADEMRRRSDEGKRAMAFKELVDSVIYECNESSKFGNTDASYRLSEADLEFREELIKYLKARDFTVTGGAKPNNLNISWTAT